MLKIYCQLMRIPRYAYLNIYTNTNANKIQWIDISNS